MAIGNLSYTELKVEWVDEGVKVLIWKYNKGKFVSKTLSQIGTESSINNLRPFTVITEPFRLFKIVADY